MTIPLAEPETRAQHHARLREHLPDLAQWMEDHDRLTGDPDELHGRVRATRHAAHTFIDEHPEVSGPVELDCQWVEAVSPPFISELLKTWPEATFVNCNEDVAAVIELVRSRT